MSSSKFVHEVCTNKFLKKLALCLTVSICFNGSISHCMDDLQSIDLYNISNKNIEQVILGFKNNIRQSKERFNELCQNKDYSNLVNLRKRIR